MAASLAVHAHEAGLAHAGVAGRADCLANASVLAWH
eukprot:COSAG02_NODE_42253_length_386_cov_0.717770_1_plen_35_part_10